MEATPYHPHDEVMLITDSESSSFEEEVQALRVTSVRGTPLVVDEETVELSVVLEMAGVTCNCDSVKVKIQEIRRNNGEVVFVHTSPLVPFKVRLGWQVCTFTVLSSDFFSGQGSEDELRLGPLSL